VESDPQESVRTAPFNAHLIMFSSLKAFVFAWKSRASDANKADASLTLRGLSLPVDRAVG
jgi:hypothetical protein